MREERGDPDRTLPSVANAQDIERMEDQCSFPVLNPHWNPRSTKSWSDSNAILASLACHGYDCLARDGDCHASLYTQLKLADLVICVEGRLSW